MGGSGIVISSGYMKKTFINLAPHDILYISFQFVLSGDWQPNDSFSVDIDGVSSTSWSLGPQITSMADKDCEDMHSKSLVSYVIGKVLHTVGRVTATIHFSISETTGATKPSIRIRDFTVMARYSQPGDMEGFYVTIGDNTLQSSTKCNPFNYRSGSSCKPCTTTNCGLCNGVGDVNCARSDWATFHSGSGYSQCTVNCAFCIDSTDNSCVQCYEGYVLDFNNMCQTSCTPPYQPRGRNAKKCLMPCNANQYLYWNNTCRESCNPPLKIDDTTQQCTYPCNKAYDDFLYWNGSCLATCPFIQRNEYGYAFCNRCAEGHFVYPDNRGICKLSCNHPYVVKDIVYCSLDLPQSDLEQARTMSNITSITSQALSVSCFLLNLVNPSDPSAFTLMAITKMLLYTRYMDLKYPPKLQSVLDQQTISQPSIKFLRNAQDLLKNHLASTPLAARFDHYGLHSSFLINFLQPLFILLAILATTLILCLTKYWYKSQNTFRALVCKTIDSLMWNVLIALSISSYDGIILYASLEIRSTSSTDGSFVYILSYMTAMTMLLVVFLISAKTISIISRLREAKDQQPSAALRTQALTEFKNQNKIYLVLYEAFKDSHLSQQSFFLLFTGRLILFHIVIANLVYYPFIQAILIFIMNVVMILYLLIRLPIKEKLKCVQQILQEVILLVVNVCVLVIASLDLSEKLDISTRVAAGTIILYCNLILSILGPTFTVLLIIVQLLTSRRGAQTQTELRVAPIDRVVVNDESGIELFNSRLDQSQTCLPNSKQALNNDRQAVNISSQNRLKKEIDTRKLSMNLPQNHKDSSPLQIDIVDETQMRKQLDERHIDTARKDKYQKPYTSLAGVNNQNQVRNKIKRAKKSTKAGEGVQKIVEESDLAYEDYSLEQSQVQKISSSPNPPKKLEQKKSIKTKKPEILYDDISNDGISRMNEERRPVNEFTSRDRGQSVNPSSTKRPR